MKAATAPYLYVWDGAGGEPNGAWPGAQMTQKDGDYWVASFDQAPLNAIFHNNQGGDSNQTGNIEGLSGDNYFTYDGTSGYTTESAPVPGPTPQPGGKTTVYVKASSAPHLYAWYMDGETAVELNGAWPGTQLTQQSDGYWVASFDAAPINIIFNDGVGGTVGVNQTENIEGISGDNYFTYDGGGNYTKEGSTSIDSVPTVEFQTNNIYTIDGRRIRQNATSLQDLKPGVYIVGGKKIVKY